MSSVDRDEWDETGSLDPADVNVATGSGADHEQHAGDLAREDPALIAERAGVEAEHHR